MPWRTDVTHCLPLNATNGSGGGGGMQTARSRCTGQTWRQGTDTGLYHWSSVGAPPGVQQKGKTRRSRGLISLSNYLLPVSHLLPGKMSRAKSGGKGTALWKHRWDREHGGVRATGQKPVSHALPLEKGRKIHLYHHGEEADSTMKQL